MNILPNDIHLPVNNDRHVSLQLLGQSVDCKVSAALLTGQGFTPGSDVLIGRISCLGFASREIGSRT